MIRILIGFLFFVSTNLVVKATAQTSKTHDIAKGIFKPDWESFEKNYEFPEWFKDAKFGIWAHWTAQCVPEYGDWYARSMYIQGNRDYEQHLAKYGHPSKVGFMEMDNLWKADKWEPEILMKLYKRAGAKYFVSLANHHDNFDNYDSKYHNWNSVNVGPHKDIVGTWAKAAKKEGLRFGVSNHSAHAWHWFQTAYGYDAEGPMAGIRYDAATLTKADGKGKWWDGLDPQDLYTGNNIRMPDGFKTIKEVNDWHEKNDEPWMENAPKNNPKFVEEWFLRCKDLIDKYHPDLLYFDDWGLPLEQAGIDITAHYYNANKQWNNGKLTAVVNAKKLLPGQNAGIVEDFERGYAVDIKPNPWQTCTCIGDWHYNREIFLKNKYKTVNQVVQQLIDIVSKNGNLLLSIPIRGDGTIDSLEVAFLKGMAKWMDVNSEAIFGTRPWKIFGEGPTKVKAGMWNEDQTSFSADDIRFTTKGKMLYALLLGWPGEKSTQIKSLAVNSPQIKGHRITSVTMLGYEGKLLWSQTKEGLTIKMPSKKPCESAVVLKIMGVL